MAAVPPVRRALDEVTPTVYHIAFIPELDNDAIDPAMINEHVMKCIKC
jgi:hypothetical protein